MKKLADIEREATTPNGRDEPTAFYSIGCCWWTTKGEALGTTTGGKLGDLPCCPHCGSVLMESPLVDFLAASRKTPEHYGMWGLKALVWAHSDEATACFQTWEEYGPQVRAG